MTKDSFLFRGDLRRTPLPEVLETVQRSEAAGVLEVTREGMVKRVHLEGAYVVHASSSDPIDRLSEHIRRSGLLDEERIEALDFERSNSNQRLGVLLVERRLLSPRQVYEAICGQIERIVWSLFAWREGEVEFKPGRIGDPAAVRVKLPVRRVAFEGIKRAPEPDDEPPAAPSTHETARILHPAFRYEDLIDIGVDQREMELLALLDGRRDVAAVCEVSPFSPSETLRRLHAFEVLSLVRVDVPDATSRSAVGLARGA